MEECSPSCGLDFLKSPSLLISGSGGELARASEKKILSSTCAQVYLWIFSGAKTVLAAAGGKKKKS